jgi:ubiquitin-conjugating enzyme E2 Z
MSTDTVVLSRETTKRLIKDVREMIKNPLDEDGIYYKHDESNILEGYAYISGPSESQYVGGNYFFKFNFPSDYPHQPPKVQFMTNDGVTRFHPNMYRNGKMCLSVLNTWRGDQWTGCQSIRTILLTIISIMDKFPLLHEPGFTMKHQDVEKYNKIILYRNIDYSVNNIIQNLSNEDYMFNNLFKDNIVCEFKKKQPELLSILEKNKDEDSYGVKTGIYNLNIKINWGQTYDNFIKIKI